MLEKSSNVVETVADYVSRHDRPIHDIPLLVDFLTAVQLRLDDQELADDTIAAAMAEVIAGRPIRAAG